MNYGLRFSSLENDLMEKLFRKANCDDCFNDTPALLHKLRTGDTVWIPCNLTSGLGVSEYYKLKSLIEGLGADLKFVLEDLNRSKTGYGSGIEDIEFITNITQSLADYYKGSGYELSLKEIK